MLAYPAIDPVAVSLGPVKIHWYGLTYIGGLAFAWWFARRRSNAPHSPLKSDQIDDLIFYAAVGIVLGGRLGYALFYGIRAFGGGSHVAISRVGRWDGLSRRFTGRAGGNGGVRQATRH